MTVKGVARAKKMGLRPRVAEEGFLWLVSGKLVALWMRLMTARPEATTPTPSPHKSRVATTSASGIYPRLSLPAFAAPKQHRTLHHRRSHPAPASTFPDEEDLFEKRFITLETLGKGAFSTVVKVQDRYGDGLFAVKKARGVFDGVKDR